MLKQFFLVISFLIIVSVADCLGCTMAKGIVIDDPEMVSRRLKKPLYLNEVSKPTNYVFIGEVVAIVKANKSEVGKYLTEAEGVKIKVTENINSPGGEASYYEVFPLRLYSDCSLQGERGIERTYPIGSQVRVIASEATVYKKQSSSDSTIRLEASYWKNSSVARNDLDNEFRATANTIVNYSNFTLKQPITSEEKEKYSARNSFLEFELQKDLVRLSKAKSTAERLKILERLLYYPNIYEVRYRVLLHTYLKSGKTLQRMEKKWEERKKEVMTLYK